MATVVLEESLKYKDGKKWKSRWGVLRRLSPVADRLHISFFKDINDHRKNNPEKASVPLEEFYGIDSGFTYDKEHHVIAIVCQKQVVVLGFQSRQSLIKWEVAIRSHLGEETQFQAKLINAPAQAKLPLGAAKLFVQGEKLCVTHNRPPRVLGTWHVNDLRKFGIYENNFCFVAGPRCGKNAGTYAFMVDHAQQVENCLKLASQQQLSWRRTLRSSQKAASAGHLTNAAALSSLSFEPPLPSPSYSTHTANYADLSLVNEEDEDVEDEEEEDAVVTIFSSPSHSQPSVRYRDYPHKVHLVEFQGAEDFQHILDERHQYDTPPASTPKTVNLQHCSSNRSQNTCQTTSVEQTVRRFSCGDIVDAGSEYSNVPESEDDARNSQNVMSNIQRNIDALGPKLNYCASGEQVKSATLPSSKKPLRCVVESHGQQNSSSTSTSSTGSVDLADAILKASGSLKSSSNSSNSSTRDLVENTPTVSCLIGKKTNGNSANASRTTVVCSICQCELVKADGSLSALCNCRNSSVGNVFDRVAASSENRVNQNGKDMFQPSILRCQTAPVLLGAANSNRPLEAVDFNRYDGKEDGEYLYWMKCSNQEMPSKTPVVYTNVPSGAVPSPKLDQRVSAASVAVKLLRDPQYVNVPSDSELEVKKSPKQKNRAWKNRLMSFHDSLRRPKSKSSSKQAVNDPLLIGSYVTLKDEKGDKNTGNIAKGKSLEDVLSTCRDSTLEIGRNESQSSLYGTPSRSRRNGKRLPPPFEPAPAIPVRMNGNSSTKKDHITPEPIYAVPVLNYSNYSSSRTTDNLFSVVRPYADHSLIACHRPERRQTVCSSQFSHLRGSQNNQGEERDPVFCTVALPPKAPNHAANSSLSSMSTRGLSDQLNSDPNQITTQGHAADSRSHDNATYLQMNLGCNTSIGQFRSLERASSVQDGPNRQRPKLHHSRSLDNELDGEGSSYTEMNIGTGRDRTLPHALVVQDDNFSTYIPMSPGASGYNSHSQPPTVPFDNLIEHQHHSTKKVAVVQRESASKQPEGKLSTDEETDKSAKPPSLLFRFIRRNSSAKELKEKEKKQSKTNDEASSSVIGTVQEDRIFQVKNSDAEELFTLNSNGTAMLHRDSDPDIHEHVPLASGYRSRNNSGNVLDPVPRRLGPLPERQHSYSYLDSNHLDLGASNIETHDQSESYSSLLDLPPAPPPPLPNRSAAAQSQGSLQQNTAASDAPGAPSLPPRTYRDQYETYMEMNIGSNSLKNPRNIEIQRPKMPTPEPELNNVDPSMGEKEVTPPPALPQKSASTKRSSNLSFDKPGIATPMETIPLLSQSAELGSQSHPASYPEATGAYNIPLSGQRVRQKKAPNLTVDVPASISATMAGGRMYNKPEPFRSTVHDEETEEDIWVVRDLGSGDSRRGTFSSARGPGSVASGSAIRGRIDSCKSDTSASTAGSSDTYHSMQDEHCVSSAITTLRPRSGKEYQRMDRRKLAEVLDMSPSGDESVKTTPHSPITPSMASTVFSFDTSSMCSHASFGYGYSSGDDSPKFPPSITSRPYRSDPHTYVNLTFHKSESPRFMDTPPASPRVISKISEQAHPQLNYAEIDLSDSSDTTKKTRKPKREGAIEYAVIDMVATAAASKVGREHAKNREDSLRRKDNLSLRRSESDARDIVRGGKERRSLITGGGSRRDRTSLMRSASSASSRDRKLSSSSYN